jgi:uncharacterized Fe-S cluster-containing protein
MDSHFAAKETFGWLNCKRSYSSNDRHTLHAMEKIKKYVHISNVEVWKGEIFRETWDRGRERVIDTVVTRSLFLEE